MAMFDVLDDMVKKEVTKTDTGDTLVNGVVVGTVTKNYDEKMRGRVCVTIPTRDSNANELKWARVASPWGGSKWGMYMMPEVGDQVLIAFEQGNIERPYVLGCVYKDSDTFLTGSVDEQNQYKKFTTKNGTTFLFEDKAEGEGAKDKMTFTMAGETYTFLVDNENKTIKFSDKEAKNVVELQTQEGNMSVSLPGKLTVKVGENITVEMDGSAGKISVKANALAAEISNELSAKANSSLKLEAGNATVNANGSLNLKSSGAVSVSGTPIKLG